MKVNGFVPDSSVFDNMKINNKEKQEKQENFLDVLKQGMNSVNDKQVLADSNMESLIKGEQMDVHKVMLATEEAKLSLQMAVQVRNKLVEAYQEINRMQL
ncbi:flagellar hook-basal body complex protein FliE [Clostridium algidicarnis]|uniref:flagellar hook-basal body complex protein FliE n=1 Tax=Clostridium algidicarnis TaxID=37659 RepID=UPI001C0CE1B1|nr:flagellar hook-basal body complex protein FliE [Clostridium algidicarnis]MBU3202960.1 flagellar hook-basal body complex protein FliE [Clostridium algidicarnis]MBU3208855.1 flagellar hook-basal body complex protein FliE [Clostridium algidicarnis]MBU3211114.1 flagellar hook-basal body complex protein FliE [Clostridium algidicarnis]MBU3222378.1 flagellar hook-basal body complex protein FliE [Clostridium algidicarnis]MBU3226634.1 flagellar hook-basal body complex protein FliE [Clostridium algid